ncbi:MAG: NADPH:quinone reductase [Pseudonocardiales bacterium]|nr:NADPH:quinone reductase [Pseudonocardiales bacterium]
MRAVVVPRNGGPDVLEVRQLPRPEPSPTQLLVEVAASGVNFIDVYRREGLYPVPTPFVLGTECAGRVVAAGAAVSEFAVGDLVATESGVATHAELALVEQARAVPVPDSVDLQVAAAVMLQGCTAHYLTHSTFPIEAGHTALVHAAAGGTGQLLVQMITARGGRVVATVGTEAKAEIARRLGAAAVIRYDRADDLATAVRAANGGEGVDVVYDGVGRATFDASIAALRRRGMLVVFGAASGPVPPFDVQRLNSAGSLFLTRPTVAHYVADRDELLWRAGEVLSAVADGSLRVQIGSRYPLEQATAAYADLEARRTTGKLLIVP